MPVARIVTSVLSAAALTLLAACGGAPGAGADRELVISAVPDQDPEKLQRLYGQVGEYLAEKLGVRVLYQPVTDYTASVTAFRRGDLDAVFFGGLSGVQARQAVPGAVLLAQRDVDKRFRSVFVTRTGSGVGLIADVPGLAALRGHSLTFGSEVSTSGRLMPQFYLNQAGVNPADLGGAPGFSGSHDATIALVKAGTYDVGALSASVWDARVADGTVDPSTMVEVFRTPTYHDYHWVGGPDLDADFGSGFTDRLRTALLDLDGSDEREKAILSLFTAGAFEPTRPENYAELETVARGLGLLR